jgi:uncharacterized protein YndB with AHSA1/START domain
MSEATMLAPVVKTVTVSCPVEHAFAVITRENGSWWPTETHSLHPGEVDRVTWEEALGGAVYEMATNGERSQWATVLAWEPPHRFVISWEVTPERLGTEVEVRFTADGDRTRVELEHRGWENLREDGAEMRAAYDPGWDQVLGRYVARLA